MYCYKWPWLTFAERYLRIAVRRLCLPEEEEFSPAGRRAADVTKQVRVRVPEDTVKTQHHLHKKQKNGYRCDIKCIATSRLLATLQY